MITLNFDYDPGVWLPVPTSFPADAGRSRADWVAAQVERAGAPGRAERPAAGEGFFRAVAELAEQHGRKHDEVWLLAAPDAPSVLMLLLDVVEADGPLNARLESWAGRTASQYDPAGVTQLDSRGLGEGYLVLRNDIDPDDRSIYATVNAVFRVQGYDVIASTQSYDTAAIEWAIPHIQKFVDGISVADPVAAP